MKKRMLYIGVGILVVLILAGVGVGLKMTVFKKDSKDKKTDVFSAEAIAEAEKSNMVVKDISADSADAIVKKYPSDPATAYDELTTAASLKISVENYKEALGYYKAAAGLSGITDEQKDYANLSIYYLAKKTGDKTLEATYQKLLGDKIAQDAQVGASQENK